MRHNQTERYGANVQHWLPGIVANESGMGFPIAARSVGAADHLGHKFGIFAPGMSVFRAELVPQVALTTFFGGQWTIDHIAPGSKRSGEVNAAQKARPRDATGPGSRVGHRGNATAR
jgi:hypothetical protein